MRKFYLPFLFSLVITHSSIAQTNISGNISSNTTWTKANSPYILIGNVGIPSSYTLTIEPGVQVQRAADYQILINGNVILKGSQLDSIVFTSSSTLDGNSKFFIEFQKSNLSLSSLQFVSFRNQNYTSNNIRIGTGAQTTPNNSGILLIKRSNISYGMLQTKGYQTTANLTMDSCKIYNSRIWGYSGIYSEPISFMNSNITNSTLISDALNYGFTITNCNLQSTICALGSGGKYNISNSLFEDSKVGTINDALLPGSGEVAINNSILRNTSVGANSSSKFILQNSKLIATKKLYTEYGIEITHLVHGVVNMSNTELQNASINNYGGIYISGGTNSMTNNLFTGLYDAVYVAAFSSIILNQNNFINIAGYHISNHSTQNFSALNNYYELKPAQTINDVIFDNNDDLNFGVVTYNPFSTTILTAGPISKPKNPLKRVVGANVFVNWNKNKETNLQKYKVYWGYVDGFTYLNSAVVPTTDSFYTITGASINDSIAVTAINTSSTGTNDQTQGYESWYSSALFTSTTLPAKLINFTALLKNNTININWVTSQEIGIASYEVEKSTNGTDFIKIGSVAPKNNSTVTSYSYQDFLVDQPKKYYRLKIINADGQYEYSKIVTLTKNSNPSISLYPNPVKDLLFVSYTMYKGTTINIIDMLGRVVQTKTMQDNSYTNVIDISGLKPSNYTIVIIGNNEKAVANFQKL